MVRQMDGRMDGKLDGKLDSTVNCSSRPASIFLGIMLKGGRRTDNATH